MTTLAGTLIQIFSLISMPAWSLSARVTGHDSTLPSAVVMDRSAEGLYEIHIQCFEISHFCGADKLNSVDRLAIIDAGDFGGVSLTLSSVQTKDVVDVFFRSQVGPSTREVIGLPSSRSGNRFSYMDLIVKPEQGDVEGSLADGRVENPFRVVGKKIWSIADLGDETVLDSMGVQQILGAYAGRMGGVEGTLRLQARPDQQIVGSFLSRQAFAGESLVILDFTSGWWDPKRGMLRLIFLNPRFQAMGLVALKIRINSAQQIEAQGAEITAATYNSMSFTKLKK